MKTTLRSRVMKAAWTIRKEDKRTWAESLKRAWKYVKAQATKVHVWFGDKVTRIFDGEAGFAQITVKPSKGVFALPAAKLGTGYVSAYGITVERAMQLATTYMGEIARKVGGHDQYLEIVQSKFQDNAARDSSWPF